MKNLKDMTPHELRQTIKTFSMSAAVKEYQKVNPGCSESDAIAYALRHWVQYQHVGEECVIAVELHREASAFRAN